MRDVFVGVCGSPCGGTNYAANLLRHHGIEVGHEAMAGHGFVCGFAIWGPSPECELPKDRRIPDALNIRAQHRVQLLRHPLATIETLGAGFLRQKPGPWDHEDDVIRALRYWVLTHERILARWSPTAVLRLGPQLADDWRALATQLGLPEDAKLPNVNTHSKPQRVYPDPDTRRPWKWADWYERDPEYAERGKALCVALRVERENRGHKPGDDARRAA